MHPYRSIYAKLGFKRAGLFKLVRETFACREVLYPGCSVHVTPSLYFSHVVYVDQNEAAEKFFANESFVLGFVNRHKLYRQSAYIRSLHRDYSQPLPRRESGFDLLLALFAGGIARSCTQYLKPGGLLLTNNHQGDALDAVQTGVLHPKARIRFTRGVYVIDENDLENIPARRSNPASLEQGSNRTTEVEEEIYYLFQCTR